MKRIFNIKKNLIKKNNNKLFTLWISNEDNKLPELQYISLKSMILTKHEVTLYVYHDLKNIPEGVIIKDGNEILDESKIFKYK